MRPYRCANRLPLIVMIELQGGLTRRQRGTR